MKHRRHILRKLNQDTHGGIATYVLIMFGMAFILYMFGYTNMYSSWTNDSTINGTGGNEAGVNDPELNKGGFIETIMNPINLLAAGTAGLIGLGIITWFMGKGSTVVWQYAMPAIILVALNIFVFPLSDITTHTSSFTMNGISIISLFLIGLFNIFYILSVIDFIRGPT